MNGEVIKSFLVGLGFGVDDTSLAKFNKAIDTASKRVAALYVGVKTSAAGIAYGISEVSQGFEQMGYEYRIISPMINKTLMLRRELLKAYGAAGINITRVIQQSVKLNFSVAKTKFAFEALYRSVASRFFPMLTKQSDLFRQKLYQNMPKIQQALERFVTFTFKAFDALSQLGLRAWSILTRIYDVFAELHKATNGWSSIILGAVVAWKALNLEFLATPLGMILTGLVAILALYDDFKTFQEGGKSLFNWGPVLPFINSVQAGLEKTLQLFEAVAESVTLLVIAFQKLFSLDFGSFWALLKAAGGTLGGGISSAFGSNPQNAAANLAGNPAAGPLANPLGSQPGKSQTNQNVSQQTSISVTGSADANSTAQAVAGQQSRVNFDLTRNLKGATR